MHFSRSTLISDYRVNGLLYGYLVRSMDPKGGVTAHLGVGETKFPALLDSPAPRRLGSRRLLRRRRQSAYNAYGRQLPLQVAR
mgnify:CR=1 FL=1